MPFEVKKKSAALSGHCSVEEAEPLLAWLVANPGGRLDLSGCAHLHAAVLQVLMAAGPKLTKFPTANPVLAAALAGALQQASATEQA